MDPRGLALGFLVIGFAGGVGLFLTTVGLRYVFAQAQSREGASAGAIAPVQRDLVAILVYGLILLAGLGLVLLTARTVYNVILG